MGSTFDMMHALGSGYEAESGTLSDAYLATAARHLANIDNPELLRQTLEDLLCFAGFLMSRHGANLVTDQLLDLADEVLANQRVRQALGVQEHASLAARAARQRSAQQQGPQLSTPKADNRAGVQLRK